MKRALAAALPWGIKGVLPEGIVALRRPGIIKGGWSGGNNAEASSRE